MANHKNKTNNEETGGEGIPTASFGNAAIGPGEQIGPYKLLRILGEGGYGIVYLAERHRPVKRRVALKVIKPGMDTKQVIARFEAERQALALLDHPNIAHVFNAGTTEAGRPYFAMEYVKGVPITEHCDRYKLTIEERLKLFMTVCEAVQYAHQKAIIHRDIKPSNILVAYEGEQAVPMIIDFGVAKALSQSLTERTLVTEQAQMIGTPEYMSPEQAEMTGQDIDTRTDVYSLGALLYELLTGTLPFDPQTLREGGPERMRHMIREQDPQTPSARLSTVEHSQSFSVAEQRRTDIRTLGHRLHGELDWITLKAMDKDRARRYQTAHTLAEDIQRYLDQEPVLAGPPSTLYKVKKFVKRNRTLFVSSTAIAAMLILATVVSLWQMVRANRAAEKERDVSTQLVIEKDRAVEAEQQARAAERTAGQERSRAEAGEKNARLNLYAADMKSTQQLLDQGSFGSAYRLLRAHMNHAAEEDVRGWEWRYLWKIAQGDQEMRLHGHEDRVTCIAFSPDGEFLASGSRDQSLIVRNRDGKILKRYKSNSRFQSVSFSKDGRFLAAATGGGEVIIWSTQNIEIVRQFPTQKYCGASVAFSPSDTLLAIGYGNGKVELWDYAIGAVRASLGEYKTGDVAEDTSNKGLYADCILAFSHEGEYLAAFAMQTHRYDIWRVKNSELIASLSETNGPPLTRWWQYASFVPGRTELFISNMHQRRILWDFESDTITFPLAGIPGQKVTQTAFYSDGRQMVSGGQDHAVRLWDVSATPFQEISQFLGQRGEIWSVALTSDDKRIATGGLDSDVLIWNVERETAEKVAKKRLDYCMPLFSRDGKRIVLMSGEYPDNKTVFYDIETRTYLDVEIDGIPHMFTEDETGIIVIDVATDGSETLEEWDILRSRMNWQVDLGNPPGDAIGYDICNSRGLLVRGYEFGDVQIFDCRTHRIGKVRKAHNSHIWGVAFSTDGSRIFMGGVDESTDICMWLCSDVDDIKPLYYIQGHPRTLISAVFSPDGRILATGTKNGQIMLWDAATGDFQQELLGHKQAVHGLAFSADGKTLASANLDGTVKLWHVATGRELLTFELASSGYKVAFSPDGETLAAVGHDPKIERGSKLRLWQAPSFEVIEHAEKVSNDVIR